jgi:hypothetical protein
VKQQIYALRLTNDEAVALLTLLNQPERTSRALARIRRRLEKAMDLIGEDP